jgi:hypothetical protein
MWPFDRLRRLFGDRGSESSVQYELLRMTKDGGWEKPDQVKVEGEGEIGIDPDIGEPQSDDEWPIEGFPGRYRLVKRVNGRIEGNVWSYETDDADAYYQHERGKEQQREKLEKMGFEEVKREYFEGPEQLDKLDLDEIRDRYEELRERRSG